MNVQPQAIVDALHGSGDEIAGLGGGRRLGARVTAQARNNADDREPEYFRQVCHQIRCDASSEQHRLWVIAERFEGPDRDGGLRSADHFGAWDRYMARRDAGYALTPDPPDSGCCEHSSG